MEITINSTIMYCDYSPFPLTFRRLVFYIVFDFTPSLISIFPQHESVRQWSLCSDLGRHHREVVRHRGQSFGPWDVSHGV